MSDTYVCKCVKLRTLVHIMCTIVGIHCTSEQNMT